MIAQNEGTQIIVLDDWQGTTAAKPDTPDYLDASADFKLNKPDSRPGY